MLIVLYKHNSLTEHNAIPYLISAEAFRELIISLNLMKYNVTGSAFRLNVWQDIHYICYNEM